MSDGSGPSDDPPSAAPVHGHAHGHGHGLEGGWRAWSGQRTLQVVLTLVTLAAGVTVAGIVVLWPTGEGRDAAIDQAAEIGLGSERVGATVTEVRDGPCSYSSPDEPQDCREITLVLADGPERGAIVVLPEFNLEFGQAAPEVAVGDDVILGFEPSTDFYFFVDPDRRAPLLWLTVIFAAVVIALGRLRGALALLGMASTIAVLIVFVAPSVLDGNDPLVVSVVAASAIAFISLYLTHGFNPTTTVALAATLGALGLTLALSWVFFGLADFTGLASEEGLTLPFIAGDIDLSSLLLGGAILGALGALDDVTVTQVATVAELRRRNPDLSTAELVTSGIRVGREHIASTVNTLLLAYAGASMPILLLFAASNLPLDMVANSELVAVEIVRTLCGSIGLVAAVPITTALAALVTSRGVASGAVSPEPTPGSDPAPASEPASADVGPTEEPPGGPPPPDVPEPGPAWGDFAPREEPDRW